MTARRFACLLLMSLVGCHSGEPSPPEGLHQDVRLDVKAYRKVVPSSILAFAFGDADGFEGQDDHPVTIVFQMEPGVQKFRLLEAPIGTDGRDLSAFLVTPLPFHEKLGTSFGEYVTDQDKDRYQYRVAAERAGDLLVSDPIPSRVRSAPTKSDPEAFGFDPSGQKFSWEKAPDAARYLVGVVDERNHFLGGAVMHARLWMFGEPVGTQTYLRAEPGMEMAGLQKGQPYRAVLFALGEDGWAVSVSDLRFSR